MYGYRDETFYFFVPPPTPVMVSAEHYENIIFEKRLKISLRSMIQIAHRSFVGDIGSVRSNQLP